MARTTLSIWQEFSKQLHTFVGRRVSDPSDVEDILQDIFVKIHTRMNTLRDEDRLAAWLYQIARNSIADYYRARRESRTIAQTVPAESGPDESDAIVQMATGLSHIVETLPDKYRQPLQLSELEGLPHREIAQRLGVSLSAVKSRVQRGRKLLRATLLACCHFELDHRGKPMDYAPPSDCRHCRS